MPHTRGTAVVLVIILAAAVAIKTLCRPLQAADVPLPAAAVPLTVAGYTSPPDGATNRQRQEIARWTTPGARVLFRTYRRGADQIDFVLVTGRGLNAIHDPRQCLTMSGWRLMDSHREPLPGTPVVMQANEAATRPGLPDTAPPDASVAYFYVVGGHPVSSPTQIRATMVQNTLLGHDGVPVYFFRFSQPLSPDPAQARRDHAGLQKFAAQMWQNLRPILRSQ